VSEFSYAAWLREYDLQPIEKWTPKSRQAALAARRRKRREVDLLDTKVLRRMHEGLGGGEPTRGQVRDYRRGRRGRAQSKPAETPMDLERLRRDLKDAGAHLTPTQRRLGTQPGGKAHRLAGRTSNPSDDEISELGFKAFAPKTWKGHLVDGDEDFKRAGRDIYGRRGH
jgi:hypothetical protein